MKKIAACSLILIYVCFSFYGCAKIGLHIENSPDYQVNTQWMSEDGNIFVRSNEHGYSYGYLMIEDEKIPVQFTFTLNGHICINGYTSEGATLSYDYEKWDVHAYKENSFTAVVAESIFFKKGQKFKFYKLNDDEKTDYEPLSFSSQTEGIRYENKIDRNADLFCSVFKEQIKKYEKKDVKKYWNNHSEYGAHMAAIAFYFAGVKDIADVVIYSRNNELFTLEVKDYENKIYYAVYNSESMKVNTITKESLDGEVIYGKDVTHN